MEVIFLLLPLALLFVGIAVAWFVWAVRSGQFDDLETPAVRILFDETSGTSPSAGSSRAGQHATQGGASSRPAPAAVALQEASSGSRDPDPVNNASAKREVEVR